MMMKMIQVTKMVKKRVIRVQTTPKCSKCGSTDLAVDVDSKGQIDFMFSFSGVKFMRSWFRCRSCGANSNADPSVERERDRYSKRQCMTCYVNQSTRYITKA